MPCLHLTRLEDRAVPAVVTWDGGPDGGGAPTDNHWTTGTNWFGDVAPQPGDDLVFPRNAGQVAAENDFAPATAFGTIRVAGSFALLGNAVLLAGGFDAGESSLTRTNVTIALGITLGADQEFTSGINRDLFFTGPIDLAGHDLTADSASLIAFWGGIVGTGNLTALGTGEYNVTCNNTFTGTTTASGQPFALNGTLAGPLVIDGGPAFLNGRVGSLAVAGGIPQLIARDLVQGRDFPGNLVTGDLAFGPATAPTFNLFPGPTSQYQVTGTVQVGGELRVTLDPAFRALPGEQFVIVANDGTDAVVGTFAGLPEGAVVRSGPVPLRITYRGGDGNDVALVAVNQAAYAVGAGAGGLPAVSVRNAYGGLVRQFLAYEESFRGGVHVATADVTGDGVPDTITAPGFGGGPVVRIWDGQTGTLVRQFLAYDAAFRGGVNLGTVFFDLDAIPEIVTGAGPGGGPHVKVLNAQTGAALSSFFAYDAAFTGGVSVSGGDRARLVGDDAFVPATVVTGAGPGGGPQVRVFDSLTGLANGPGFFAYEAAFTGGVYVAYDNGTIVTTPGFGGGPVVRGFDPQGRPLYGFDAYNPAFRGGATVAVLPIGQTGEVIENVILTGAGPTGGPHVRTFVNGFGPQPAPSDSEFAFDPAFLGGVFVG